MEEEICLMLPQGNIRKMLEKIKECSYVLSNHIELDSVSKVRSLVLMPSFGIMRVQQHWIKRQILTHL